MGSFIFKKNLPWVYLPSARTERNVKPEDNDVFNSFRYMRLSRRRENCWPWRLFDQMGWDIHSPVDVTLEPLIDIEMSAALTEDEVYSIAKTANLSELWRRGESYIAFPSSNWIRLYDFQVEDGWMPMFTPNGQGTIEWNLGWSLDIPESMAVMIMEGDVPLKGLEIPGGIIISKKNRDFTGFSIALDIKERTTIRRGDVIARMIPISKSSLRVQSEFIEM